jgi:hypothetical protein
MYSALTEWGKIRKIISSGLWHCVVQWKKNIETLIDARKDVGLEVKTKKTSCMLLPRHQNGGQNHDIRIAIRSFENVAQFT